MKYASVGTGRAQRGFSVTFERFLPHEDDEDVCEADETGFVIEDASLRDAITMGLEYSDPSYAGPFEADSYPMRNVRWLIFFEWNRGTREQIYEGVTESRSLHFPEHITESSRNRIIRLFKARR